MSSSSSLLKFVGQNWSNILVRRPVTENNRQISTDDTTDYLRCRVCKRVIKQGYIDYHTRICSNLVDKQQSAVMILPHKSHQRHRSIHYYDVILSQTGMAVPQPQPSSAPTSTPTPTTPTSTLSAYNTWPNSGRKRKKSGQKRKQITAIVAHSGDGDDDADNDDNNSDVNESDLESESESHSQSQSQSYSQSETESSDGDSENDLVIATAAAAAKNQKNKSKKMKNNGQLSASQTNNSNDNNSNNRKKMNRSNTATLSKETHNDSLSHKRKKNDNKLSLSSSASPCVSSEDDFIQQPSSKRLKLLSGQPKAVLIADKNVSKSRKRKQSNRNKLNNNDSSSGGLSTKTKNVISTADTTVAAMNAMVEDDTNELKELFGSGSDESGAEDMSTSNATNVNTTILNNESTATDVELRDSCYGSLDTTQHTWFSKILSQTDNILVPPTTTSSDASAASAAAAAAAAAVAANQSQPQQPNWRWQQQLHIDKGTHQILRELPHKFAPDQIATFLRYYDKHFPSTLNRSAPQPPHQSSSLFTISNGNSSRIPTSTAASMGSNPNHSKPTKPNYEMGHRHPFANGSNNIMLDTYQTMLSNMYDLPRIGSDSTHYGLAAGNVAPQSQSSMRSDASQFNAYNRRRFGSDNNSVGQPKNERENDSSSVTTSHSNLRSSPYSSHRRSSESGGKDNPTPDAASAVKMNINASAAETSAAAAAASHYMRYPTFKAFHDLMRSHSEQRRLALLSALNVASDGRNNFTPMPDDQIPLHSNDSAQFHFPQFPSDIRTTIANYTLFQKKSMPSIGVSSAPSNPTNANTTSTNTVHSAPVAPPLIVPPPAPVIPPSQQAQRMRNAVDSMGAPVMNDAEIMAAAQTCALPPSDNAQRRTNDQIAGRLRTLSNESLKAQFHKFDKRTFFFTRHIADLEGKIVTLCDNYGLPSSILRLNKMDINNKAPYSVEELTALRRLPIGTQQHISAWICCIRDEFQRSTLQYEQSRLFLGLITDEVNKRRLSLPIGIDEKLAKEDKDTLFAQLYSQYHNQSAKYAKQRAAAAFPIPALSIQSFLRSDPLSSDPIFDSMPSSKSADAPPPPATMSTNESSSSSSVAAAAAAMTSDHSTFGRLYKAQNSAAAYILNCITQCVKSLEQLQSKIATLSRRWQTDVGKPLPAEYQRTFASAVVVQQGWHQFRAQITTQEFAKKVDPKQFEELLVSRFSYLHTKQHRLEQTFNSIIHERILPLLSQQRALINSHSRVAHTHTHSHTHPHTHSHTRGHRTHSAQQSQPQPQSQHQDEETTVGSNASAPAMAGRSDSAKLDSSLGDDASVARMSNYYRPPYGYNYPNYPSNNSGF